MLIRLLNALFGCRHKWSWPRRRREPTGFRLAGLYQFCSQCGATRTYNGPLADHTPDPYQLRRVEWERNQNPSL